MPQSLQAYQLLASKCSKTKLVLPINLNQTKMAIVGESLGKDERDNDAYFVGAAGKLLDKLIREAGLIRSIMHITNVIKVYIPTTPNKENYLNSIGLSTSDFIPYLTEELERINPKIILAVGGIALETLTNETSITKWRGSTLKCTLSDKLKNVTIIPTLHPSYLQRGKMMLYPYVRHDVVRFAKLAFNLSEPAQEYEQITNPNLTEVVDFLHDINANSTATTFDIETVAKQLITCIGFTKSTTSAICIPFRHNGLKNRWEEHEQLIILDSIRQIYNNPKITKIAQNIGYELHYLLPLLGFPREPLFDTMHAHQLIHPDAPHDLGFLISTYTKMPYHKDEFKDWEMKDLPHDQTLWEYNIKDVISTHRIYERFKVDLQELNLYDFFVGFVMPLKRVLFEMEHRGINVDKNLRDKKDKDISENQLPDVLYHINELTGKDINPNSSLQVGEYLTSLNIPIPRTDKGNYTVKEDKLDKLRARFPQHKRIMDLIICARKLKAKTLGTYLRATLSQDGRLRTRYNFTKTGRLSSKENHLGEGTNLQNQPKRLRTIYIPDKDHVFLTPDLEQAEALVQVFYMKAEKLKKRMLEKEKIHAIVAEWIDGKKISELTPERYRDIKSTVYGCVDAQTEVLTTNGWIPITNCTIETEIAQWNPTNWEISFVKPLKLHKGQHVGDILEFTQGFFNQRITPTHRMPHWQIKKGRAREDVDGPVRDILAKDFKQVKNQYMRLPLAGKIDIGTKNLTKLEAGLLLAIQADGCIRSNGAVEFNFKKPYKINRLCYILDNLGILCSIYPTQNNKYTSFYISKTSKLTQITDYLLPNKTFNFKHLIQCKQATLHQIVTEACFWDGRTNGPNSWQYYTTNKQNAEIMTTLAHLTNHRGIINDRDNTGGFGCENAKRLYIVSISRYPLGDFSCMHVERINTNETVYCPTVPTGYFVIKRNDRISITGNSNYRMGVDTFATTIGKTVAEAKVLRDKYYSAVPELPAYFDWIENELKTNRKLTNPYKRVRIFTGMLDVSELYSAYAQLPQSTVADTINLGILGLWLIKPQNIHLLIQVHDEVVISLPLSLVEWFKPYIKLHLSTLREIEINNEILTIPVDIGKVKTNWYGKED